MVSVIIVNFNGKRFLGPCLDSLEAQTYRDFEVLLVDNASSDGSVAYVEERYPKVRVFPQRSNTGFSAGNNIGIEHSRGDLTALLNNDTEVDPNWLAELVSAIGQDERIGSCASRILLYDDHTLADACGDYYTAEGAADKIGHLQPADEYEQPREVFAACAGAAIYRSSMLKELGGFDEDFFIVHEDSDLSFRAQLMGYRCVYVPTAVVYHHLSATLGRSSDFSAFHGQRNLEFVYIKNMPLPLLFKYLPGHVLLNMLLFSVYLRGGQGGTFVHAKLDALRLLPKMLMKRRVIQRRRRVSAAEIDRQLVKGWFADKTRRKLKKWKKTLTSAN